MFDLSQTYHAAKAEFGREFAVKLPERKPIIKQGFYYPEYIFGFYKRPDICKIPPIDALARHEFRHYFTKLMFAQMLLRKPELFYSERQFVNGRKDKRSLLQRKLTNVKVKDEEAEYRHTLLYAKHTPAEIKEKAEDLATLVLEDLVKNNFALFEAVASKGTFTYRTINGIAIACNILSPPTLPIALFYGGKNIYDSLDADYRNLPREMRKYAAFFGTTKRVTLDGLLNGR